KLEMDLEKEKHANEIKSGFLFNLSHDIRTPMNAIVGFSELAKRHINDPRRLESYLGKVGESSRQLLALIDDLLEMSKIEYGRIEIKAEPCDLREQIGMVLDLLRAQAEEKKLNVREQLELPEGQVLVDTHRFRRVLGNLIGNAVKFTPPGGTVSVSARQKQVSESGYARYEFTVSDTGVGMSEDFMKHMYEAFEREESSTRAGTIGTGLGLSIAKKLLDIMGDSISVRSRKGAGSTFTVDLPLKLADRAGDAPKAVEAGETDYRARGEHRILLVEDIEINRMLADTIREEAGFLVESVPDGCDAVDAVLRHGLWYYDLVLMDIQMPVMNGYEATRSIRALNRPDVKSLPIIALSANARDEDKRASMESGMNNHVAKPFDVAHLIATVNEHIAARVRSES
ncbi:MAG: response regulator, partial [Oscillospiraceae bacterium]|nr:response regulator [Oscillospiraceae bacterium]